MSVDNSWYLLSFSSSSPSIRKSLSSISCWITSSVSYPKFSFTISFKDSSLISRLQILSASIDPCWLSNGLFLKSFYRMAFWEFFRLSSSLLFSWVLSFSVDEKSNNYVADLFWRKFLKISLLNLLILLNYFSSKNFFLFSGIGLF